MPSSTFLTVFQPEAVLTVADDFLWLAAARYARRHSLPLHLICHDDWTRLAVKPSLFREWLNDEIGKVYRQAVSRLCVSPHMAEEYERRYGVKGTLLYPSRARDCAQYGSAPERLRLPAKKLHCSLLREYFHRRLLGCASELGGDSCSNGRTVDPLLAAYARGNRGERFER